MAGEEEAKRYPFSAPHRLDMDPAYAEIRANEGLIRVQPPFGRAAWLATRYEDVKTVLGDPRFSRARALENGDEPSLIPMGPGPNTIVTTDPPHHSRLRRVVAKAFTQRRIEQLRPRVQEIVDGLIDDMEEKGPPSDLVHDFARPQPGKVVFELMGVPYSDREQVQEWTEIALSTPFSGYTPEEKRAAFGKMRAYMPGVIAAKAENPGEDLLTVLVTARDDEDRLTEDETVDLAVAVLVTGNETTADQILNLAWLLLSHPEHLAMLRAAPEKIPQAIDEMLRYVPLATGAMFPRVATEDVRLGDVLVREGEAVLPSMASANRDETAFPNAGELDFDRESNQHLALGHGVHRCLGAQLARMELQVAFESLLDRFPGLRLVKPAEEVPWRKGTLHRAPQELLVTW
ncbi:cytochrome [Streptomyces sp. CB03234]|uniref:cytochrome P450 n=1 Tax=Streptomyces sp. (strain CB03234) TaxID=1703937 RepID=UPI00093CF463|nr:cytochrome P450 [Streptomyces sp. CB03234]OKJ94682.1 cytochrome [Streptomyces sp. CB03234]